MTEEQPQLLKELTASLEDLVGTLDFGTIELTFHQGQLVQVEKREKRRFGKSSDSPGKAWERRQHEPKR